MRLACRKCRQRVRSINMASSNIKSDFIFVKMYGRINHAFYCCEGQRVFRACFEGGNTKKHIVSFKKSGEELKTPADCVNFTHKNKITKKNIKKFDKKMGGGKVVLKIFNWL